MKRIWNKHKISTPLKPRSQRSASRPGRQKILAAMSGGVDSSVAAKLLKDQGHEVTGVFLNFWKEKNPPSPLYQGGATRESEFENKCCSNQALNDARKVADKIGILLYTLNFSKLFKKRVVDDFLNEYASGRTPNPCARCNKYVKLGYLIKVSKKLGFDYVATGHYAGIKKARKQKNKKTTYFYKLYKARDQTKDQSYFLYALSQDELSRLLFPLADYTKQEVRRMAKKFKLPVAKKKDSQEVCFISEKTPREFLKRHLKMKAGPIVPLYQGGLRGIKSSDNQIIPPTPFIKGAEIGRHQGLPLYTIGQRKGLITTVPGPFYVIKKDHKTNTLFVVKSENSKELYKNSLTAKNINWQAGAEPIFPLKCQAVIRYGQKPIKCQVKKIKGSYSVKFDKPVRAVAPGQSAVFYKGREVIGGGIIA